MVEFKALPEDAVAPHGMNQYIERYGAVQVFYIGIDYTVHRENKYFYNGVNYELLVLVPEDGVWRIAQLSPAPVSYLVQDGYGFQSETERVAGKIFDARLQGLIINAQGQILETNIADLSDLQASPSRETWPEEIRPAAFGDPTEPSTIRVWMDRPSNRRKYGCPSGCVKVLNVTAYMKDVLANEWTDTGYPQQVYLAGAIAVKTFSWFRVHVAPLNRDYDLTDESQVFLLGTARKETADAIDAMQGIGMYTANSRVIFRAEYRRGEYAEGRSDLGEMQQRGTYYWSDNGKTWTWMAHYYYDKTFYTNREDILFFFW